MKTGSFNIIQRKEYIEAFKKLISLHSENIIIGDTEAIYGSGKTTIIDQLHNDLALTKSDLIPLKINLQKYSFFYSNIKIEDSNSIEALKQNFYDYKNLIIDLSNLLHDSLKLDKFSHAQNRIRDFELRTVKESFVNLKKSGHFNEQGIQTITKELNKIKGGDINIGDYTEIIESTIKTGDINTTIHINIGDEYTEELILESIHSMQKKIAETYNQAIGKFKLVLLVDNYCWVIDQKTGKWFFDLINMLDNTVVVLFRTISSAEFIYRRKNISSLSLLPFNKKEVEEYLTQNLTNTVFKTPKSLNFITQKLLGFSGGHPLLLNLIMDVLNNTRIQKPIDLEIFFRHLFETQPSNILTAELESPHKLIKLDDLDQKIHHLLHEFDISGFFSNKAIQEFLKILSISRALKHSVLIKVLQLSLKDEQKHTSNSFFKEASAKADFISKAIEKFSFVRMKPLENPETKGDFEYVVHSRIRHSLQQKYLKEDPVGLQQYHVYLASVYGSIDFDQLDENLIEVSDEDKFKYKTLYRIENLKWQENIKEWFFHLFQIENKQKSRLLFAKIYLQAFDWYDYYIPFQFCSDLISLWKRTQNDDDFINTIDDFQKAYPRGFDKYGFNDTKIVPLKLRRLLKLMGLNKKKTDQMTSDERMAAGVIYCYMGDGYTYSTSPNQIKAEKFYKKAIQVFEDDWYILWVISDLASMYCDYGQPNNAIKCALKSNEMVLADGLQEEDHEVISQNYLTLGEAYLENENFEQMKISFARSLIHAYLFPFDNGIDIYTISWYNDIVKCIFCSDFKEIIDTFSKKAALDLSLFIKSIWYQSSEDIHQLYLHNSENIENLINTGQFEQLADSLLPQMPALESNDDTNYELHLETVEALRDLIELDNTALLKTHKTNT